jgi:hypothetical protein
LKKAAIFAAGLLEITDGLDHKSIALLSLSIILCTSGTTI